MQKQFTLLFLLLTVAIDAIGIGIIFPVMPDLMRQVTHADLATASLWGGVLATSFAVMQFLFGPMVGNLSDAYGRRPVLLVALAVMAVDYAVMALAPNVWVLLVGRIVAGIAAATYATANAYLADITAPDDRGRVFGYLGAAFGIGFIVGPLIGGVAGTFGVRAPFAIAALLSAANLALGTVTLRESLTIDLRRPFQLARANPLVALRAIRHLPGMGRYLAISAIWVLAYQSYTSVWAFYGTERFGWNAWWNGMALAAYGLGFTLVLALLVGPAIKTMGERRTAIVGMVLDILAFVAYGFLTSGFWAMVVTPLAALGGIGGPALQALMTNATPADQQGELQGVQASVSALASGVSPMVMTFVFYSFTRPGAPIYSPGAPFLLGAALMALALVVLLAGRGRLALRAPAAD